MFADDSCLVAIHRNLDMAVQMAQQDFIVIQKYFYNNDIYINEKKTEAMIMGVSRGISEINQYPLKCHSRACLYIETYKSQCQCPIIKYSENCKYLGINVDNKFKMKTHVNLLCKKLRVLHYQFQKSNVNMLSTKTKLLLYNSLVESLLRYGVTIYTFAPTYILEPLNSIQRRIIKYLFVHNSNNNSEETQQLKFLKPIQLAKLITITQHYQNPVYRKKREATYQLRRQQEFESCPAYTKYGERLLCYTVPKLLNRYQAEIDQEEHPKSVKSKLKRIIIEEEL
ncbi:hypothetical protein M8J77_011229 [Diaphorina citri]|nr:hypothetical protein M8J77_011229 [Diaphorina citri]